MATKNAINSEDPVEVAAGGTGAATLTDHGVLVGSGTGAVTALAVGTTGQLLVAATGADPAFSSSAEADFTFGGAESGSSRRLTLENTSNTAGSNAVLSITTAGGSAGDPKIVYTIDGVQSFVTGIDNSDSDSYKLSVGTALGTTDVFIATQAGEITMPLTPAFLAVDASATNVTGDGTNYTLSFATEIFDQNSDWNGSTTFTAPVTGRFQFDIAIRISGLTTSHTEGHIELVTSNRTYLGGYADVGACMDVNTRYSQNFTVLADMDATDTATVVLDVSNGTKVVDVDEQSYFSGYLAC